MGFNSVYRMLQEVFPQVDSRILKAVAIENSKDAGIAFEVVLFEVIPSLPQHSFTASSPNQNRDLQNSSMDCDKTGQLETTLGSVSVTTSVIEQTTEAGSSINGGIMAGAKEDAGLSGQLDGTTIVEPFTMGPLGESSMHDANGDSFSVHENSSHDDLVRIEGQEEAVEGKPSVSDQEEATLHVDITSAASDCETSNHILTPRDPTGEQLAGHPELPLLVNEEFNISSSSISMSEKDALVVEPASPEDEPTINAVVTRSDQISSRELLDNIIEDTRANKKALVSTMESVMDLMRDVQCKEKAAVETKEAADGSCSDILAKVDELKQALRLAKEANDMHAGEVYAEKAILSTEAKELQHRLLSLSDEKDKSLGILDEMRKSLETRLAMALAEIESAEQEKQEKQRAARELLAFQESQMEKVVEESKRLKLEAEENSKMQDFLMDRGHAIDMLQGEISVKCQDVSLLKEKFDKRIPLGRSLSSNLTSSILASSSSSNRSFTTPSEENFLTFETQKSSTEFGNSYGFLDKSSRSEEARSSDGEEKQRNDRKVILDDGWELFENVA